MAGEVKRLIDELMQLRTKGNPTLEPFVRVNLMLSGVDPSIYTPDSPSDPDAEQKIRKMIDDFQGTSTDGAS